MRLDCVGADVVSHDTDNPDDGSLIDDVHHRHAAGRLRNLSAGLLYQPGGVAGVGQVVRLGDRAQALVQTSNPDLVTTRRTPAV